MLKRWLVHSKYSSFSFFTQIGTEDPIAMNNDCCSKFYGSLSSIEISGISALASEVGVDIQVGVHVNRSGNAVKVVQIISIGLFDIKGILPAF